jgi:hypothetical protein
VGHPVPVIGVADSACRRYVDRAVEEHSVKVLFSTPDVISVGWRARRRSRRRLAEQDRLGARLAELVQIRDLAAAAREVVAAGWVRNAWYVSRDAHGRPRFVDVVQARRMGHVPVDRACRVGAILHAGGGVASADTQLVQRTFDLTWHTLHGSAAEPDCWCPAPPVRAQHLRDLVRWNDRAGRTDTEVEALLRSVEQAADAEVDSSRRRLAAFTGRE